MLLDATPLLVAFGDGASSTLSFTDADGTVVMLSLRGATGVLTFSGDVPQLVNDRRPFVDGANLLLERIDLNDATDRATLTITTRGGDGSAFVNGISVNGSLRSLSARGITLAGNLHASGAISALTLGNVLTGRRITLGGDDATRAVSITLQEVVDLELASGAPISRLMVQSWQTETDGGALVTSTLGSLTSKGDFDADVALTGLPNARSVLGSARITGGVHDSFWFIAGPAGAVTAGDFTDWRLNVQGDLRGLTASTGGFADVLVGAGNITGITSKTDVLNSMFLAGTDLGTDFALDGEGAGADVYGPGAIGSIRLGGSVLHSSFRAGGLPVDGQFGNLDDLLLGGKLSSIRSLMVGGAVSNSQFAAATLPRNARFGGTIVDPLSHEAFNSNSLLVQSAAITDGNGMVTLTLGEQTLTLQIFDESTFMPIAGAAVGVALEAQTLGFGVGVLLLPDRPEAIQLFRIEGTAVGAVSGDDLNYFARGTGDSESVVTLLTSQLPRFAPENPADFGEVGAGLTALASAAVQSVSQLKDRTLSRALRPLAGGATTEILTVEQTLARLAAGSSTNGSQAAVVLLNELHALDPFDDAGSLWVDLDAAFLDDLLALPGMDVVPNLVVTRLGGLDLLSYTPPSGAVSTGLLQINVPNGADLTRGQLEILSTDQLGRVFTMPLAGQNQFEIEVPAGSYRVQLREAGYAVASMEVNLTAAGQVVQLTPTFTPLPEIDRGYTGRAVGRAVAVAPGINGSTYRHSFTASVDLSVAGTGSFYDPLTGTLTFSASNRAALADRNPDSPRLLNATLDPVTVALVADERHLTAAANIEVEGQTWLVTFAADLAGEDRTLKGTLTVQNVALGLVMEMQVNLRRTTFTVT